MKHLGDITKISGYEAPIVDVIVGGSPCQDLSVAGKRAGLEGERSGLFMEQIRIVKEMRERDRRENGRTGEFVRCRWLIWENVKGAFSSPGGDRKGQDFAAVIEEVIKVVEPNCPSVQVPKNGWSKSGCFYDEMGRWSVAWTIHCASKWCVPQRRERISLVADFGGMCAAEILFERSGLCWNPVEGEQEREATPRDSSKSIGESNAFTLKIRGGVLSEIQTENKQEKVL